MLLFLRNLLNIEGMIDDCSLVILAAGMGSRFGGDKQIALVSRLHWPLLRFTLFDAQLANIRHVVIVTRNNLLPFFKQHIFPNFKNIRFDTVCQEDVAPTLPSQRTKPWGTGHAALCAQNLAHERFIVINADDFYGRQAIAQAAEFLKNKSSGEYGCVGYPIINTLSRNGTVSRGIIQADGGYVQSIHEHVKVQLLEDGEIHAIEQRSQKSVIIPRNQPASLNLFALDRSVFYVLREKFQAFLNSGQDLSSAEFPLPSSITAPDALQQHAMKLIPTTDRWIGLTYANDLPDAEEQLNQLVPTYI